MIVMEAESVIYRAEILIGAGLALPDSKSAASDAPTVGGREGACRRLFLL
jgi:hypothetical protein